MVDADRPAIGAAKVVAAQAVLQGAGKLLVDALSVEGQVSVASARRQLLAALSRPRGRGRSSQLSAVDGVLGELATAEDVAWAATSTYWHLRRMERSLRPGVVFTPPALAREVVARLRPGCQVVDLGAGTGMLTLAAAARGFKVTAVEEDDELAFILAALARMLRLEDRVEIVVGDAFRYRGRPGSQIMANPPYTRHHLLPDHTKRALSEIACELGTPLRGTAGHYAYFMVHAWHAAWSEREVLLVPTNWLEAGYGEPLRDLLRQTGRVEIAIADHRNGVSVFGRVLTTSCIVTTEHGSVGRGGGGDRESVRLVGLGDAQRHQAGEGREELARTWWRLAEEIKGTSTGRQSLIGDVFRVRRGVATGANSFFVLSEEAAKAVSVAGDELIRVVRTLSPRPGQDSKGSLWVAKEEPSAASLARIRQGEELGVDRRYLCRARNPWWRIKVPEPPRYLLSYMGRGVPTVVENVDKLTNLNNVHGLYLVEGASWHLAERVVEWLRAQSGRAALLRRARHYQGGLWKLEPRDVEGVELPEFVEREAPK